MGWGDPLRSCRDGLPEVRLDAQNAALALTGARRLSGCTGLQVVKSIYGHDGFLVEFEAVSDMIRKTLDLAENESA